MTENSKNQNDHIIDLPGADNPLADAFVGANPYDLTVVLSVNLKTDSDNNLVGMMVDTTIGSVAQADDMSKLIASVLSSTLERIQSDGIEPKENPQNERN